MSRPGKQPPPAATILDGPPPHFAELIERAATLVRLLGAAPGEAVPFRHWLGGVDREYLARLDWPLDQRCPRVLVFDARSGHCLCRSLPGWPFAFDPAPDAWQYTEPQDAIDRAEWNRAEDLRQARRLVDGGAP